MNLTPSMKAAFKGRTVLLTGAGSGIGKALTRYLVEAGAKVHGADRDGAALEAFASELRGPGSLVPRVLDVTDREDYGLWVENCFAEGPVDFLFNNAGVTLLGDADRVSFARWKWLLDINLLGVINGILHVYPRMVEQKSGHIISTGSVAGVTGYATAAAYTTAKGAVIGMSTSLAAEAKAYGVKISVACPGYVNSNIFSQDRIIGADAGAVVKDLPAPMMSPEEAAWRYLKGVVSGKKVIVFPANAKLLWLLATWTPFLLGPIQKRLQRKFSR